MRIKSKLFQLIIPLLFLLAACHQKEDETLAFGHFESDELLLSAEVPGKLLALFIDEGQYVEAGDTLGWVDHQSFRFQLDGLAARKLAIEANVQSIKAQKRVAESEIVTLADDLDRIAKLADQGAATERQYQNLKNQLETARRKLTAIDPQILAVSRELNVIEAEEASIQYSLSKSFILSPVSGRILNRYCAAGEMVSAAKPIAKIADTRQMYLKVYLSGNQLASMALGQQVQVQADAGDGEMHEIEGVVSWISDQAEFTPKVIQTREERVDLVYAIKVALTNPGYLKIGMPGELMLK